MTLPEGLRAQLAPQVEGTVQKHEPVGGGCIANAGQLITDKKRYFLKWARGEAGRTFEVEAAGLRALREADCNLLIPEVLDAKEADDEPGYLLMEWIETGQQPRTFWKDFGENLAKLHQQEKAPYGFERDNFIGELPQQNNEHDSWPAFFWEERLTPQAEMARDKNRWRSEWDGALSTLSERLGELLPERPAASVLHGDLWSGNYMIGPEGEAVLIDPATYYGHRETDLAMTELFGGFEASFYEAYRAAWAMEPGYEERRSIYNLYHLINHLNHFGRSYAPRVNRILKRFA